MNRIGRREGGFSFLELMTAVAIIAILGALAVVGYQEYTVRSAAADLVSAHHTIRTSVLAQGDRSADSCADLASGYDRKALADPYAALDYGFEAVAGGGFRPVLTVCATAGGPGNVAVVKRAYESFLAMGVAEKSPTPNDTLASFSVRLTDGDKALCKTAPASRGACGQAAPAAQATVPAPVQAQPAQPAGTGAPAQAPASGQMVAAVLPTCPAGQQMMTHLVSGAWQRACQPTCARGQQLNPATRQCEVDHGGPAPATTGTTVTLAPSVQRQVQAAEQQLAQSMATVKTLDDAIVKTMAAAQGLPEASLTQSIPGNSPVGRSVQANCKLPEFPDGACKDQVMGNFCAQLPPGASSNCPVAIMCPKTLGVCQGVTPEMRRIFDQSMQRIVGDWFAQHPGCTRFGQTGC